MPGNIFEVLVRAVRLVMVFQKRSFHRVQRLSQYILLECRQNEQ